MLSPPRPSSLLNALGDGLLVVDEEGTLLHANPAACELLGRSRRRIEGRDLSDLVDLVDLVELCERCREGQRLLVEVEVPAAVGLVEAHLSTWREGDRHGVVVLLRERRALRELEDRLRAEDRARLIAALAAGLAHEVRNPLGGIRGAAQLIGRGESAPELSALIVREVDRIAAVMSRWMELSRPQLGEVAPVALNQLIDEERVLLDAEHAGSTLAWELDLDPALPPCRGDEVALRQLVRNLLRNAWEAAGVAAGRVRVTTRAGSWARLASRGRARGVGMTVRVEDNGPGVDEALADSLFDPFVTGRAEGHGMGLFVAWKAARDHGGHLTHGRSEVLGGAAFTLTLHEHPPGPSGATP